MDPAPLPRLVRFATFEVDLQARELRRNGVKVKLQDQPFQVLVALLDRPAEIVTRKELRRQLWPDDTFVDFENSLNAAVNRLREALDDSADNPRFVETIPRRGYRFIAPVRTADGGLSPPAETASAVGARRRFSSWVVVAVVALLAGLGYFAWQRLRPPATAHAGRVMLAVLPFENLTGDSAQEYLADGLTEEMITQLASLEPERFGVIARTSAMTYKGARKTTAQIGRELGLDYLLEGSLRRAGDRVRVSTQLIRVRDQTHLWAENYDRDLGDILTLQGEVVQAIANAIRIKLTTAEQARLTRSRHLQPDAHEAYLKARYYHSGAAGLAMEKAIENYNKAIAKDPSYALAYAGLARAYLFGVRVRPKIAMARAHEAVKKALELDPTLPEAQIAWAMTKLYDERDLVAAEKEFRRAVEMDPGNADTHFYYSHCLTAMGRFEEGVAAARRAQRLDPFSTLIAHYIGRQFYFARQYDKAVEEFRKTLELDANYAWSHIFLAITYEKMSKYDQAVAHRQKYWALIGKRPEDVADLGTRYVSSGYPAALQKWTESAKALAVKNGYLTSTELTHVYAQMGETQEALRWLEKAVEDHTRDLIYLKVEPGFDSLRSDPRFQDLLRRIGLPP